MPSIARTPELTVGLLDSLSKSGPTDPIEYYRHPLIGHLYRKRINLSLRLLGDRRYAKALEIGYGAGAVLLAIAANVDELHGIDLDADAALVEALLWEREWHAKLVKGSVYELPYDSSEFDLVVCFSVFEHLQEYGRGLSEVARVLKPGGRLLLGMPAVNLVMEAGFLAIGFKGIGDHHVTTPRTVARAFDQVGLRVLQEARLRPIPGVSVYFNWLLKKVDG
jgi:2-polyprenyl-3-methyl-5-hydroxy-6-metoxy-1,4-benzoquinol methylase